MGKNPAVLFFRGLNTYGDDVLHLGPVTFGETFKHWSKALSGKHTSRSWTTTPILTMGAGGLTEMVDRSKAYIKETEIWSDSDLRFHILAHSTGGVVARALLHDPEIRDRVISLTTIGTPHFGAVAAVRSEQVHSSVKDVLKVFGYDLEARKKYFADLLPESMDKFNDRFPNLAHVRYASILGEKPPQGPSFPMRFMELSLGQLSEPSDGLIPVQSQRWGEVLGHVHLDHLEQVGFCFHIKPAARQRFRAEWKRLISILETFWTSLPSR